MHSVAVGELVDAAFEAISDEELETFIGGGDPNTEVVNDVLSKVYEISPI
jgi:hypothetical protein